MLQGVRKQEKVHAKNKYGLAFAAVKIVDRIINIPNDVSDVMKQADTIKIINRLIKQTDNKTSELAAQQIVVDTACFTEPALLAQERQRIFLAQPQVIAFAAEVARPKSFYTTECLGIPLLFCRDEAGVLKAFLNACPHRGARLASGSGVLGVDGQANRFVCPFHGWVYNPDGQLHGRPQAECFEPAGDECQLTQLAVSDKYGLLVVGLTQQISQHQVDSFLDSIGSEIESFELETLHSLETRKIEAKANWKLIAQLSHESYHFANLHRDSVAQYLNANAVYDTFGKHSRWAFAMKGLDKLKRKPESEWPRFLNGAINHTLFPGTVMITNPEDAQMIRVEPGEKPGESTVYFSGVFRNADNQAAAEFAFNFGFDVFSGEDLPIAEQAQQAYEAGQQTMIIGRNEPVVAFWQNQWAEVLKQP